MTMIFSNQYHSFNREVYIKFFEFEVIKMQEVKNSVAKERLTRAPILY